MFATARVRSTVQWHKCPQQQRGRGHSNGHTQYTRSGQEDQFWTPHTNHNWSTVIVWQLIHTIRRGRSRQQTRRQMLQRRRERRARREVNTNLQVQHRCLRQSEETYTSVTHQPSSSRQQHEGNQRTQVFHRPDAGYQHGYEGMPTYAHFQHQIEFAQVTAQLGGDINEAQRQIVAAAAAATDFKMYLSATIAQQSLQQSQQLKEANEARLQLQTRLGTAVCKSSVLDNRG